MIVDQLRYISPEIALLCSALLIVLLDLFIKQKKILPVIAAIGIFIAAACIIILWGGNGQDIVYKMLAMDQFVLFFKLLILISVMLVVLEPLPEDATTAIPAIIYIFLFNNLSSINFLF